MIRALYVDDEPDLLALGEIFLERGGEVQVDTAHSTERALEMLETTRYDVVVSDYRMPEQDGIALLKRVSQEYANIPFILFTGKGCEVVVNEAITEGAAFSPGKDWDPGSLFAKLGAMIRWATGCSRMKEQLQFARFCLLRASDAIFWINPDGTIRYVSDAACLFLGYTREDLQEITVFDIYPDISRERWEDAIREIRKTGISCKKSCYITRDGVVIPVEITVNLIGYGRKSFICIFSRRISPEKDQEDTHLRDSLVIDATRHAVLNSITSARAFQKTVRNRIWDPEVLAYLQRSDAALARASVSLLDEQNYRLIGRKPPVWQDLKKIVSSWILTCRNMTIQYCIVGDDCEIFADPGFPLVFRNIFQMIGRFRKNSEPSQISLSLRNGLSGLAIVVESTGTGIPFDEKEIIFRPGYLSISDTGLFIAKEILEVTGIGVRETGNPDTGIRFEIHVPSARFRNCHAGKPLKEGIREPVA